MSNLFTKQELLSLLALEIESYSSQPKLPAGFQLIGMIQADTDVTAKILAAQDSVHLPFLKKVLTPDPSPWGLLCYDPLTQTVHILIRGTEVTLEWIADFLAILSPLETTWDGAPSGLQAHAGFQLVFRVIRASLASLIAQARALKPIAWKLGGHSLGSPLSALARLLLLPTDVVSSVLWAPPRTGSPAFSAWWNGITPNCMAMLNDFDIVWRAPPARFNFGNIGQPCEMVGGGLFDLKRAHNLELGYLPGVQKLAA